MKIISILNIKGGVGKSLTAENLARGYAASGKKTLLVDADGQGDVSAAILPDADFESSDRTICSVFLDSSKIQDCIWHTNIENLDLIPATMDLFDVIYALQGKAAADFILGKALHSLPYDIVIIDNNPSVNKMTFNSIYAADLIICPTNIGKKTIKGVVNTRKVCAEAVNVLPFEKPLNFCILLTMMGRTKSTKEGAQQLREIFGDEVLNTEIRYQAKPVQNAEFNGKSLLDDSKAGVAEDYRKMVNEVISKENI